MFCELLGGYSVVLITYLNNLTYYIFRFRILPVDQNREQDQDCLGVEWEKSGSGKRVVVKFTRSMMNM